MEEREQGMEKDRVWRRTGCGGGRGVEDDGTWRRTRCGGEQRHGGRQGVEEDRGQVEEERRDDALEGRVVTWAMVRELVGTKRFWRYCALSLCLVNLRAIFRHLDATFPTYLLREHGQGVPKGIIYSINPAIIIIFTPLIAASTTEIAHFDMIKWGSWFSGLAALPLDPHCSTASQR